MRIAIDLDDRTIRTWAGQTVSTLSAKRRDAFSVEVKFLRGGVVQELSNGATGKLGIKALGDYSAVFLASALTWTKTGTGTSAIYTFSLTLNTTEIATEFTDDPPSIDTALEVEWVQGTSRESSLAADLTIHNDYVRGDEGVPTAGTPSYPLPKNIPVLRIDITGKTGSAAADLDAIVTLGIDLATYPTLYLVKTGAGGGIQGWQLTAGTDAEDVGSGIVRPDDYAAATNEKVWKQVF